MVTIKIVLKNAFELIKFSFYVSLAKIQLFVVYIYIKPVTQNC